MSEAGSVAGQAPQASVDYAPPIVQERFLPVSPGVVFDAWSDPESLSVWMCPLDNKGARVSLDFRVGGRFSLIMEGEEQDYEHSGEYLEIVQDRRIVFTWVSHFFPKDEQQTRVTVTMEPEGDGTRLKLVHDQLPNTGSYDNHRNGWVSILDKLEAALAER